MGKFDGILICTDLDGTLLNNDKVVSKENLHAIEYFKQEGGYFSFITGRMPYIAMNIYNTIKPNAPFGVNNGGGLFDGKKKKYVWKKELSRDVFEIVKYIDNNFADVGIFVNCFERTFLSKKNKASEDYMKLTNLPNLFSYYEDVEDSIAKITFCSYIYEDMLAVEKALRERSRADDFTYIRSEKIFVEVLPKNIDKGVALKKMAEHLGVDVNKTVAIGDYNNDVSMIKFAKVGVAVKNACKEVLDVADYITVSNNEHAIAKIISDIENGTIKI